MSATVIRRPGRWSGMFLAAAAAFAAPLAAPQRAEAQEITVSVRSLDDLIVALRAILVEGGQEGAAGRLDQALMQLGGGQGLKGMGLDGRQGAGAFVYLPEMADGAQPGVVAVLPIADKKLFLDTVAKLGLEVGKPDGEISTIAKRGDDGEPFHLKVVGGWGYASNDVKRLQGALPDPKSLRPGAEITDLVSLTLRPDKVGAPYKDLARTIITGGADNIRAEASGKPAGEALVMNLLADAAAKIGKALLDQTRDATISADYDVKTGKIATQWSVTPLPGTEAAEAVAGIRSLPDMLGGLPADLAMGFGVRIAVPAGIEKLLLAEVETKVKSAVDGLPDGREKDLARKAYANLLAGLRTDLVEGSFRFRGPDASGLMTGLMAARVKDAAKLEAIIRDVVAEVGARGTGGLTLDAESHRGTSLHRIRVPVPDETPVGKALGSPDVNIAFHKDLVLVGIGRNGAAAVKDVLDGIARPDSTPQPPLHFEMSAVRFAPFLAEGKPGVVEKINAAFRNAPPGADKVRIFLEGGKSVRLRFEFPVRLAVVTEQLKNQE